MREKQNKTKTKGHWRGFRKFCGYTYRQPYRFYIIFVPSYLFSYFLFFVDKGKNSIYRIIH